MISVENFFSHDNFIRMNSSDSLVRQNLDCGQRAFILDLDVFAGASYIRHANPASNGVFPANDGVADKRVGLDDRVVKDSRILDANTSTNLASLANNDVGAKLGRLVNLGALVDDHRGIFTSRSQVSSCHVPLY